MPPLFLRARARWLMIGKIVAAGLLVAAGIAVALRHLRPPAAVEAPTAVAASVATPAPAADAAIPSVAESDSQLRAALSKVTPRSLFQTWLRADSLLERLVVTTVDIAEGQSPARQLSFLRPRRAFRATRDGSRLTISSSSYARWDAFANVISSVDDRQIAVAYRTLHPLLESGYHALGYPGRPLDELVKRALQRIVDAPIREQVEVERAGSFYLFTDPRLESLDGLQKQLLRMGPRNTRLLHEQAQDIASALGMTLTQPPQAAQLR